MNKECLYYDLERGGIRCNLCPHKCFIRKNEHGICKVREAKEINGKLKLYTLNYGEITSIALDPIEKKPLAKFFEGEKILSIGTFGCNMKCSFCQNYSISQFKGMSKFTTVYEIIDIILHTKNNLGIAFTYNEPTICYEYILEIAKTLKSVDNSKKVVLVTNGYINEEPLIELLKYVDALNIDLKGNNDFYKKICFGTLKEVENTIKIAYKMKKHIEITTLLITNRNTDYDTIKNIGKFISEIDNNIPLHISRYFPRYKMEQEQTTLNELKEAFKILKEYLNNVYIGNVTLEEKIYCENT